jgi:hypothetical protein
MRTHVFPTMSSDQYRAALAQPYPFAFAQQGLSFPRDLLHLWQLISQGKSNNVAAWFNMNRNAFV